MNRTKLAGIAGALALAALGEPACAANTWLADCSVGQISKNGSPVVSGLTASNTLGFSLLGTPTGPGQITPGPAPGDLIEINSICTEDVTVTTPGLTIVNHNNSDSFNGADGVQGQFEFVGVKNTEIDGILLSAPTTFGGSEVANLFIHDGAAVAVRNSQVSGGPLVGILVTRTSAADIRDSTISGNGSKATDDNTNMGLLAASNATIYLGKNDGTNPVMVQNNSGAGIVATDASSIVIYGATFSGSALQQVALFGASSGLITGMNANTTQIIAPSAGCCQAVFASGASTLDVEQGATITGNQTKAAIGLDASTLVLQGSVVTSGLGASTPAKSEPTIHGTANSVIALAGGNTICFGSVGVGVPCNVTAGGFVFGVDHVSTLIQVNASVLGYAQASDNAGGGGEVILQSTVDLGLGLISGNPSLSWTTSSEGIEVAQNSSFRLEGGVAITGNVLLGQGSNGFFNKVNGGNDSVSGGVSCFFTTVPASHVVGNAVVTPPFNTATSMSGATANQCLPF